MRKNHLTVSFFSTLIILSLSYRIWFLFSLKDARGNMPSIYNYLSVTAGLADDLIIIAGLTIFLYLLHELVFRWFQRYFLFNTFIKLLLFSILLIIAFVYVANKKATLVVSVIFSYKMLVTGIQEGFNLADLDSVMSVGDWVFLISPLILFYLFNQISSSFLYSLNAYVLFPISLCIVTSIGVFSVLADFSFKELHSKFYANPMSNIGNEWLRNFNNQYTQRVDKPIQEQLNSVHFVDPVFTEKQISYASSASTAKKTNWNIVLIILESVGAPYVFDTRYQNKMPMSFLHELAKKGWYLNNNYATGNSSPTGLAGLISGIYPDFVPFHFILRPDIKIPTFATYLTPSYDSFFIQAGAAHAYFPEALFKNSGYKELYDSKSNPILHKKFLSNAYIDEQQSVEFFLSRLARAKPPFLATYYSGAAHYPYFDYPQYRIMPNIENSLMRYLNNLYLLDQQIKNIYQLLAKKHWLDNTVIIITGDHGEGFTHNNEEGGLSHNEGLFLEQIKVPVIFYQPKIFKPRIINQLTSSVDILPTALSAMNISYNAALLQGESLLQSKQFRKYIFIYNDGMDEVAAINKKNQKMQVSFFKGSCRNYDLNNDPKELKPLPCQDKNQETAIIKFRNYQYNMLQKFLGL